ncbi:hypothetical protein ACHHYP_11877 [Achlya hypogyna]|uniref:mRNA m(6)A methyltransferase n=1 Tax=Achlya hypogyna TaxID=1202772 RepID=A0A1V9YI59_ACHHY|nr:hypothetical protein ACHHYP_11877 [Achlya hypogyna]
MALARRHDVAAEVGTSEASAMALAQVVAFGRNHPELLPIDLSSLLRRLALPIPLDNFQRTLADAARDGAIELQAFDQWTFLTHVGSLAPATPTRRFVHYCPSTTRAACRELGCAKAHFVPITTRKTNVALGDCKYLDQCHRPESCAYIHYRPEAPQPLPLPTPPTSATAVVGDVTALDWHSLGKFDAIIMDPPWEINMKLSYATLPDAAIQGLPIASLQDAGWLFLWVTTGKLVAGRRLLRHWGYTVVDDIVWVKVDQLQRVAAQGRTGHWLNHSHEHCLVGQKGLAVSAARAECDVIVAAARESSRKPDELYGLVERCVRAGTLPHPR